MRDKALCDSCMFYTDFLSNPVELNCRSFEGFLREMFVREMFDSYIPNADWALVSPPAKSGNILPFELSLLLSIGERARVWDGDKASMFTGDKAPCVRLPVAAPVNLFELLW